MKKNTKHFIGLGIILTMAVLLGGSASGEGQLKGLLIGASFMGISLLVMDKLPLENKKEKE